MAKAQRIEQRFLLLPIMKELEFGVCVQLGYLPGRKNIP